MKSRTKMPEAPANQDLSNQKFLSHLLATRELKQFWELGEKMVKAGKGKNKRLVLLYLLFEKSGVFIPRIQN